VLEFNLNIKAYPQQRLAAASAMLKDTKLAADSAIVESPLAP